MPRRRPAIAAAAAARPTAGRARSIRTSSCIKTDHELTDAHRLTLRYNHQNFTGEGFENGGPQNSIEHTGASLVQDAHVQRELDEHLRRRRCSTSCRLQFARDQRAGRWRTATNPEAVVQEGGTTVLTIGRNNFSPRETTINRWQVADTATWIRGAHKLKGGFDFQFDDILNHFPGFFSGSYTFRTWPRSPAAGRTAPNEFYQQNFQGAGHDRPGDEPEHPRVLVLRAGRMEAAQRPDASTRGLRYDLMKTAPPPVRNPDAQLAAADIDTSRSMPTPTTGDRGSAWPGARAAAATSCAAAGASSTAARRRSCSAPRTRTTASTSSR